MYNNYILNFKDRGRVMKKLISLILCLLLSISMIVFTGCNSSPDQIQSISEASDIQMTSAPESYENQEPEFVAGEGKGSLYDFMGNTVLVVRGTPDEMGYQQGVLLKDKIQALVTKIISKSEEEMPGKLQEIWDCQKDHIPDRFKKELEGIARGSGVPLEDLQLANIMPELFHCSGIALFGDATYDGSLYHVRILDYMTEYGLQDLSVVIIAIPDGYNSFINASFAGFIGSVTGMNNKKIAIGEMGGGGEGDWDGVPMSILIRMALEETDSLDESLSVFKNNPRTCEYYYVISDAKTNDAVGIYAKPDLFLTVDPGQNHPLLPLPLEKDTLILSGEDRYLAIHERVGENYGKIDENILIEMIKRPVSMKSNLHNAIFHPDSLTMWLAVAGDPAIHEDFQACYQEYFRYDLQEWLQLTP
jgi:isopenicillin-N N-acyltransferase like protein